MRVKKIGIFVLLLASVSLAEKGGGAFESAKQAYESGNYSRALDLFEDAIRTANDASTRNRANYFQGLVLFEMGHYFASYISFRNVLMAAEEKNRELYEKAIKNAVLITDSLGMVHRLGKVLAGMPAGLIPTSVSSIAHYAQGVHFVQEGNEENASSHLKSVNPESPYYPKALFHLGVLATKKRNYNDAVFYFSKAVETSRGKKDLAALAEISRLNLARSLYSQGQLEKSIQTYSQFVSTSPHWLTVLLEASWPLMRMNDTTVSLGNLHTVLSPYYREDLVAEAYVLRATILYSLCKYEEMRRTLAMFFNLYDPILRDMQAESNRLGGADSFYSAFTTQKGLNNAFINAAKRDPGVSQVLKTMALLRSERDELAKYSRNNDQIKRIIQITSETEKALADELGATLQRIHKRKLAELLEHREQANYLKVEIVTGEKELIEGQKGLPPKRIVDVETTVSPDYRFWPFIGEYWEDELGTYVYTTESACVN